MAILVARSLENGGAPLLGDRQEVMRLGGGADGVHRHLNIAVGGVLEAHRTGQAGRQLPVGLAFGGARAYGAPGDQVGVVLGADEVQVLGAGGQAHIGQVQQQLPGHVQALVDLEGVVEVGVVDQPLPAHGGAGLFEIHPHHHEQVPGMLLRGLPQQPGVFPGSRRVMYGAGADHDQQAVVLPRQDTVNAVARIGHCLAGALGNADVAQQLLGRNQFIDPANTQVVGGVTHVQNPLSAGAGEHPPPRKKADNIPLLAPHWQITNGVQPGSAPVVL